MYCIKAYVEVAISLYLTVSFPKTKFMVVGSSVSVEEQQPLAVGDGFIEWVDHFPYLGSVIAAGGGIDADIDKRIANASKVLVPYVNLFLLTINCPSKLSAMCIRLVYHPPFCTAVSVGHHSVVI